MIKEIRLDPVVASAIGIKHSVDAAIDFEKIAEEARVLQSSRTSRKLYKVALEPTSLADAAMRDMSARSRLAELKATVSVHSMAIATALEKAGDHVSVRYANEINLHATNAPDRKRLVNKILSPLVDKLAEIASTMEVLETFLKDIDQSSYQLRNATELMKLIVERRVNTV